MAPSPALIFRFSRREEMLEKSMQVCGVLSAFINRVEHFEDVDYPFEERLKACRSSHAEVLCALQVEGKGVINQTQAIARYVGHLTGLYPADPFLSAKCDEAIDGLTDVTRETPVENPGGMVYG